MRPARHIVAGALVALLALAGVTAAPARAGGSQAVVIVDTGNGTYTRVISFSGTVSGYEALALAGANPETYGFAGQGAAICRLFGVGNDPSGSSCLGTPDDPRYWAYFRAPSGSGGWSYSGGGAGATRVGDGDVEGWRFGTGGAPPYRSFCDVVGCAPPPAPAPAPAPPAAAAPAPSSGGVSASGTGSGGPGPASASAGPTGSAGESTGAPGSPTTATAATPEVSVVPTTRPVAEDGAGRTGRSGDREDEARASGPVVADDGGSGSPVGVIVAVGLVAAIAAVAVVLRRRGRSTG